MKVKQIENLVINQFRGLRALSFADFGHINLLVGFNNSGKTSVLEAIAAACRPLDPIEWLQIVHRRSSFGPTRGTLLESLEWLFPRKDTPNSGLGQRAISLDLIGEFPVRRVECEYSIFESVPLQNSEDEDEYEYLQTPEQERAAVLEIAAVARQRQLKLPMQEPTDGFDEPVERFTDSFHFYEGRRFLYNRKPHDCPMLPVQTISPYSHRSEAHHLSKLIKQEKSLDYIVEILREFDDDIVGLHLLEQARSTVPYVEHQKFGLAPVSVFGDGLRRVMQFAFTLPQCKDGVLLVDELESSVHAQLLPRVFAWLRTACEEYNIQLFATTHSLEAVDAVLESCDTTQELVTYRVSRRRGSSEAIRFDYETLARYREELAAEIRW